MEADTSRAASDRGREDAAAAAGRPGWARRLWALAPALVVTFSSAMALYYQALVVAPMHHHSFETFYAFDRVADARLVRAWTPRVVSRAAAEWRGAHGPELPRFRTALKRPKPSASGSGSSSGSVSSAWCSSRPTGDRPCSTSWAPMRAWRSATASAPRS